MLSQLDLESKGQGHSKIQKPMPWGTKNMPPKKKLGHSDIILKNLVKGHIELPNATAMLKQTNLAARFCKIMSKVKFSMCSQIVGN